MFMGPCNLTSILLAARRDLVEGAYYPCASIYTLPEQTEGATVTFNFGVLDRLTSQWLMDVV